MGKHLLGFRYYLKQLLLLALGNQHYYRSTKVILLIEESSIVLQQAQPRLEDGNNVFEYIPLNNT
jgi:hypothetical protein